MNSKKKIVFNPNYQPVNKYIEIIVTELQRNGFKVISLQELFSSFSSFWNVRIVHLNWYETASTLRVFTGKFLRLILILLFRKKIFWTMHNKGSRDFKNKFREGILRFILVYSSHKIVIHSHISQEILLKKYPLLNRSKIIYIPHPNYLKTHGRYINEFKRIKVDNSGKKLKLAYVGSLKPYKGVELLIDVVKDISGDVELTINGSIFDQKYADSLVKRVAKSDKIFIKTGLLSDEDLVSFILDSDLVVLPYDNKSSLNSGMAILCFSCGRTLISTEFGTILDLANKNLVLSYTYNSEEEHIIALKHNILRAIQLKSEDNEVFLKWGNQLQREILIKNDAKEIGLKFANLYN